MNLIDVSVVNKSHNFSMIVKIIITKLTIFQES